MNVEQHILKEYMQRVPEEQRTACTVEEMRTWLREHRPRKKHSRWDMLGGKPRWVHFRQPVQFWLKSAWTANKGKIGVDLRWEPNGTPLLRFAFCNPNEQFRKRFPAEALEREPIMIPYDLLRLNGEQFIQLLLIELCHTRIPTWLSTMNRKYTGTCPWYALRRDICFAIESWT